MKSMALRSFRLIFSLSLLRFAAPAQADILMVVDDPAIKGESRDASRKGAIEIQSFSVGAANSGIITGGGGSAGRVNFQALNLAKVTDTSSTALLLRCASGQRISKVTLLVRKTGTDKPLEYYDVVLEDVLVSSISTAANGERPSESVSLSFGKITFFYFPQDAAGKLLKPTVSGWDISKNVPYSAPVPTAGL